MARSLARGLLHWRASTSGRGGGLRWFYRVPDNDTSLSVVAEPKIRKTAGKGIADKILAVVDKIHERRLPPELRRGAPNGIVDPTTVEADVVNVAEQRILRSMMNGDFEKLPGKGKPLKCECNPHADPAEDMAYRILAKNGFAPEWVELNKEIRFLIQRWRAGLESACIKASKGRTTEDDIFASPEWKKLVTKFEVDLKDINRKVLKYNLLVPFGRQVMSYKLDKELVSLQVFDKRQRSIMQGS